MSKKPGNAKKPGDLEEGTVQEKASLLAPLTSPEISARDLGGGLARSVTNVANVLGEDEDTCIIKYDPTNLTSLSTLCSVTGSAFVSRSVLAVVFVSILVMSLTAFGIVKAIDHWDHINPESFSTETISSVIRSISLAMTFLLGLFVNNAVVRWWGIVKDLEDLLGSGEKLIMMLIHVNADRKMREDALRRVIIACEMLRYNAVVGYFDGDADLNWSKKFDSMVKAGEMTKEDRDALEYVDPDERCTTGWALCSQSIRPIDDTQPRASVHVYKVVQDGISKSQALATSAMIQFPYLYTHLLAYMVHLVNVLTSLCAGVTIGIVIARARVAKAQADGKAPPQVDGSAIFKEILFLFIQVFLYQAFLGIGAALSFPIVPKGHGAMYRLPFEEMIISLRSKLERLNRLACDNKI
jgi:hypothetical protein